MAGLKILSCKMGKHEWVKSMTPDGKYEVLECAVCKTKKYNMGGESSGPDGSGQAAQVSQSAQSAEPAALPAGTDELTGLMDKGGALESIKTYLKSHKNDNYTLCMCDIDDFRNLNATKGTECGDLVLKEVASILKTEIAGMGTPCRWGGDEFLLLFPSKNGDEVYNKLFSLREKIKARVLYYDGDGIGVTMTFGLTEYDFSGKIDAFVAEAQEKLEIGKQMGKDQVLF